MKAKKRGPGQPKKAAADKKVYFSVGVQKKKLAKLKPIIKNMVKELEKDCVL